MDNLTKTLCVSFPRSGHHLLVNLLLKYFSQNPEFLSTDGKKSCEQCGEPIVAGKLAYCEHYNHCEQVPCCDPRVNLMKNHDLDGDLNHEQIKNKIVQYRHPLKSLASLYEYSTKQSPRNGGEWETFLEQNSYSWERFVRRWILVKPNRNVLIMKYEDLTRQTEEYLRRALLHLGEENPDHNMIRRTVQAQQIRPGRSLSNLSAISAKSIRRWEDRNDELLRATGIPRISSKRFTFAFGLKFMPGFFSKADEKSPYIPLQNP